MSSSKVFYEVPVIVLCGGRGLFLTEEQIERKNKALISINEYPLIYWVLLTYARHGARNFILAVGMQYELFTSTLLEIGAKPSNNANSCFDLSIDGHECKIHLVHTEATASTGSRLMSCKMLLDKLFDYKNFAVTYSDTLSTINLEALIDFHIRHGLTATLTAVKPPIRFRILGQRTGESLVRGFAANPIIETSRVNGGFYIFSLKFWRTLNQYAETVSLEEEPLEALANQGQLAAFEINDAWQTCDAERDLKKLALISEYLKS